MSNQTDPLPSQAQAIIFVNNMLDLNPFFYSYNPISYLYLEDLQRKFKQDPVLSSIDRTFNSIYNGSIPHLEIYPQLRSSRLSVSDVKRLLDMDSNGVIKSIMSRRGLRKADGSAAPRKFTFCELKESRALESYQHSVPKLNLRIAKNIINPQIPSLIIVHRSETFCSSEFRSESEIRTKKFRSEFREFRDEKRKEESNNPCNCTTVGPLQYANNILISI